MLQVDFKNRKNGCICNLETGRGQLLLWLADQVERDKQLIAALKGGFAAVVREMRGDLAERRERGMVVLNDVPLREIPTGPPHCLEPTEPVGITALAQITALNELSDALERGPKVIEDEGSA